MSFGGWVDKGLGKLEEGWDAGKKLVGEGVDKATDVVGGGLEYVGAEDWADSVEDWGDRTASSLGAKVGEQQLGQTEEANELIHGNVGDINASVKNLQDFQSAFDSVGQGMKGLDSSHWKGAAADTFREKFQTLPIDWLHAADAFEGAAKALETYATTVTWAQGKAREAIALYKQGQEASKNAADAYKNKVDAFEDARTSDNPLPRPECPTDPGDAVRDRAREILNEARRQRDEAADTANKAVTAALAHAPAMPSATDRAKLNFVDWGVGQGVEMLHLSGGVVKGVVGITNFVRSVDPLDPYNISHPAEYYKNLNMTLAGLASTAAHPDRALKSAWEAAKGDPSEFLGRLIPELIGTKGAGGIRTIATAGLKNSIKHGADDAARSAARKGADEPARSSRTENAVENGPTDPIDLATGVMYLPQRDVVLPGVLPLVFRRRVASDYRAGRWFGPSWSSTADQRLEIDSEGVVFVRDDGLLLAYPHPAPGVPVMPSHGPRWPLDRDGDDYTVTDPDTGCVRHFTTSGAGLALLAQMDDRHGNWITFEYDAEGSPTRIVHGAGYRLELTTSAGRITALHLAGAAPDGGDQEIRRYGYTGGNLTEVINSSGEPLRFAYDERARVTSWTDTNGSRYDYTYDDRDRCVAEGGAEGHIALRVDYDGTDAETGLRVTTVTMASGAVHRYLVNDAHQVVAEIDPLGTATRFERDRYNRLLSRTNPLGRTTRFRYDEEGRLTAAVRPDGHETTVEYNDLGMPVKVVHPDLTTTLQEYDDRGNRVAVTDSSGVTTYYTYDEHGCITAVADASGNTTLIRSNAAGLSVEITDPMGGTTRVERDAFGRPVALVDPLGATTRFEWTSEGKLARRTEPDGTEESWTYDGEGNCLTHTDAVGGVTRFAYTHFDLMAARTGPDGVRYEFRHDAELRLTQVVNPLGQSWDYEYDAVGRLISESDFDDRTLTYTHDAAGGLATRTDAVGRTIRYERDELGRVTAKDVQGTVTRFTYYLSGQLAEAVGTDATVTYLRDRFGHLKSETVNGRTVSYTYDGLGRRVSRTTPAGAVSSWAYDAMGRRAELTTSGRTLSFERDAAGRETARHIGEALTFTSRYDELGRLTGQRVSSAGRSLQHRSYTYRADGNLIGMDDQLSGSRSFELDAVGRVTAVRASEWTERYAYDATGNQTEASWPTAHPGQEATGQREYTGTALTRAGSVRYEHDELGRVVLRRKTRLSRKPETWRYEWDPEDRLTRVTTPDGTMWRYHYDPLGRRIAKQRLAPDGAEVLEQVSFTWDGTVLCEQATTRDEAPGRSVVLTWDHNGLRPLAQTERVVSDGMPQSGIDERFFAIVTDLVGTPTELIDEESNICWRTRATLWGATAWNSGASAYTPLRFAGQYFDPETGIHYNCLRYYDPEIGRYISADPLGLAPAPNPSAYVSNPLHSTDHLGLAPDYHEFHTVQDAANAERLRGDGNPWPAADTRGQWGEGVYSWGTLDEAVRYAERIRGRGGEVEILTFKVSADDFAGMNRVDITKMTPDKMDEFFEKHSRIYSEGGAQPHNFDYVRGPTGMGVENYFSRGVFHLLKFVD
ncbi:putative T7SS-secreted protein [Streptomyces sp. NPDC048257]|uniref:putative T7SS-secreted protein n=1 Tax=Streptomyces sp. NPDC048257 TaxID=3365526 RepID=UPI003719B942